MITADIRYSEDLRQLFEKPAGTKTGEKSPSSGYWLSQPSNEEFVESTTFSTSHASDESLNTKIEDN